MKPNKSKRYCIDGGRTKILFETEKKAMNFIKFNADEIKAESGYCPSRAYYCIPCGGYHITSRKVDNNDYFQQRDRMMQELYDERLEKQNAHYKRMELQKISSKRNNFY